MKLDTEFIKLPLAFDVERMRAEVEAVPESDWRPHPQGHPGNSALPLISPWGPKGRLFRSSRPTQQGRSLSGLLGSTSLHKPLRGVRLGDYVVLPAKASSDPSNAGALRDSYRRTVRVVGKGEGFGPGF